MTLRRRILLAVLPLFVLLVVLGGTAIALLRHLGDRIDQILRENYDSVIYMRDLNEALERIDSACQFTIAGRERQGREMYDANWPRYAASVDKEQHNITVPGEKELVAELTTLTTRYRQQGMDFFAAQGALRKGLYFSDQQPGGLYATFRRIKDVSGQILKMNEHNMEQANAEARSAARSTLLWYGLALALGIALAMLLIASTVATILNPIRAVTESATAIGAGDLDQVVPITSHDELGRLAAAFNAMARQLRDLRATQHAQLIRAQQTSQATIDSFPDPVLVVDHQQRVELANPVARRLLGVVPREDADSAWQQWEPPPALRPALRTVLDSQRPYLPEGFDQAVTLPLGDDAHFFLPRILPMRGPEGETIGAAVLLEDVTRFRLLDEMKSNLVATVSHELKTPLTSIRLVLHLLLEENLGPLSPKQLELLVDARDNAERLLTMINNLLDMARLEHGPGHLRLLHESPADVLQAACDVFRPRAEDRGVQLQCEAAADLPHVAVDPERFQHALQNLLDNALTHTPQGGQIALAAARDGQRVLFIVADTGSGIPAEYLPLVFQPYFRVPGETAVGGSGLGLAIVQEIVTAHGGAIACESHPGEKTVFRISLPAVE
jgi:two-component system, NtrC family, sensor histidine kinase KinB